MSKLKAKTPDQRRLLKRASVQENGCWLWTGPLGPSGYGQAFLNGKVMPAHRALYIAETGAALTSSDHVCHKCDVPQCVNPAHMFIGKAAANMADMVAKGRHASRRMLGEWGSWNRGERSHRARLTESQVSEIRALLESGMTCRAIAENYPISRSGISKIKHNNAWKHAQN